MSLRCARCLCGQTESLPEQNFRICFNGPGARHNCKSKLDDDNKHPSHTCGFQTTRAFSKSAFLSQVKDILDCIRIPQKAVEGHAWLKRHQDAQRALLNTVRDHEACLDIGGEVPQACDRGTHCCGPREFASFPTVSTHPRRPFIQSGWLAS